MNRSLLKKIAFEVVGNIVGNGHWIEYSISKRELLNCAQDYNVNSSELFKIVDRMNIDNEKNDFEKRVVDPLKEFREFILNKMKTLTNILGTLTMAGMIIVGASAIKKNEIGAYIGISSVAIGGIGGYILTRKAVKEYDKKNKLNY